MSSELMAYIATGAQNVAIENITKSSQNYETKGKWDYCELLNDLDEQKLINDLKEDTDFFDDYNDSLFSDTKIKVLESVSKKENYFEFGIDGGKYHILDEILFCVEDGEFENWDDIFNSSIEMRFGGSELNGNKMKMEYNILINKLLKKNIIRGNSDIIIPSAQFELLKNNFKINKKNTKCDGFLMFIIAFHQLQINMSSNVKNIKLKVKYRKVLNSSYYRNQINKNYQIPIFGLSILPNLEFHNNKLQKLPFNHVTKFIIIKILSEEQDLLNIHNINLYLCNGDPIKYNMFNDEIIEINNFGNKYFIIALSPSFKNASNLCQNLQNGNLDKYGINLSRIDQVDLEILDINENIKVDLCSLHTNIARSMSGMIGLAYAN